MLKVIEKVDRMIKTSEYKPLILKLSKIQDKKEFYNILDNMPEKEAKDFAEAVIGLTYSKKLEEEEKIFFEKYKKYCIEKANNDIKYYLNNNYLRYLFTNKLYDYRNKNKKDAEVNGIKIRDLFNKISYKYNAIIKKMDKAELNKDEQDFIKNYFYVIANYIYIQKEEMYNVVKFFDKYPIDNSELIKKGEMYILYILSSELIKYDINTNIVFNAFDTENIQETAAYIEIDKNNILIRINRMSNIHLKTEEDLIERLFSLFHELRHLEQDLNIYEYTNKEKAMMKIESKIIESDKDFYNLFHDNFFVEKDADRYAEKILKERFKGHKNIEKIVDRIANSRKMIPEETFELYLIVEAKQIINIKKNKSK